LEAGRLDCWHGQVDGDNTAGEARTLEDITYAGGSEFIYFKITQTSEHGVPDRAWTAPVFLSEGGTPTPVADANSSGFSLHRFTETIGLSHFRGLPQRKGPSSLRNRITGDEARNGRSPHTGCPVK